MSLVWLTDAQTNHKVAVNPYYVTVVFTASEGDHVGKTVVGLINGSLVVSESELDVVTALQG